MEGQSADGRKFCAHFERGLLLAVQNDARSLVNGSLRSAYGENSFKDTSVGETSYSRLYSLRLRQSVVLWMPSLAAALSEFCSRIILD